MSIVKPVAFGFEPRSGPSVGETQIGEPSDLGVNEPLEPATHAQNKDIISQTDAFMATEERKATTGDTASTAVLEAKEHRALHLRARALSREKDACFDSDPLKHSIEKGAGELEGALTGMAAILSAKDAMQDLATACNTGLSEDILKAADSAADAAGGLGEVVQHFSQGNTPKSRAAGTLGGLVGVKATIQKGVQAGHDWQRAMATGQREDFLSAAQSMADFSRQGLGTALSLHEAEGQYREWMRVRRAVDEAATLSATGTQHASQDAVEAAARAAARQALKNGSKTGAAAREAATKVLKKQGLAEREVQRIASDLSERVGDAAYRATDSARKNATKAAARTAAKEASTQTFNRLAPVLGEKGAARAARRAAAKASAKTLARAGGRFVPGVNMALAAVDTARAAAVWSDPKAPLEKKVGASVTALGSSVAATNIPVVSQVGAAVSVVSDFVNGLWS